MFSMGNLPLLVLSVVKIGIFKGIAESYWLSSSKLSLRVCTDSTPLSIYFLFNTFTSCSYVNSFLTFTTPSPDVTVLFAFLAGSKYYEIFLVDVKN